MTLIGMEISHPISGMIATTEEMTVINTMDNKTYKKPMKYVRSNSNGVISLIENAVTSSRLFAYAKMGAGTI